MHPDRPFMPIDMRTIVKDDIRVSDLSMGAHPWKIDDSSVPADVKAKIYRPSATAMINRLATYNPYQKLIVIPVCSQLWPFNSALTTQAIRDRFFGTIGTFTVSSYFGACSYLQYGLGEGWISAPVQLTDSTTNPQSTAVRSLSEHPDLIRAALAGSTVDWARFADGNHVISEDQVTVILIAPFGTKGGAARAYDIDFTVGPAGNQTTYTLRGRRIVFFDCLSPASQSPGLNPLDDSFPTALHELCHSLFELPDRYGNGSEHGGNDYVGEFDLMSDNSSTKFLNPHDRMKIGWFEPKILHAGFQPPTKYALRSANAGNEAIVLYMDTAPEEYWIIENRYAADDVWRADTSLPQSGLLIWWVDMSASITNDMVVLLNQHETDKKPLDQSRPSAATGPAFDGSISEVRLFPQYGTGWWHLAEISTPGSYMSVTIGGF